MIATKNSNGKSLVVTKHPSQNYIKYLLLNKNNVSEFLKRYDLPDLPNGYLDYLKKSMPEVPQNFDPNNRYHRESLAYIKELQIYNLFFPDRFTKEAMSYLEDLEIRMHIESMLLSRTKPIDIAKAINSKLNSLCTEEGIDRYRHYFWNVNILKIDDWNKILENPSERYKTKRLIRGGPSFAKYQLGGFQQKVEAKQLLSDILTVLKHDIEEIKYMPTSEGKIKMLSTSVNMIGDIDDRLTSMDITMKDTLKQFERFKVDHVKANVKPISESAAIGNYSNSGMVLEEIKIQDANLLPADGYQIIEMKPEEKE